MEFVICVSSLLIFKFSDWIYVSSFHPFVHVQDNLLPYDFYTFAYI